jgi:hypothetical protein
MYRENGKAVFPSIRSMIRQAEAIGRESAEAPRWTNHQKARFAECVDALGYNAARAIVEEARQNRSAELELSHAD